MTPPFRFGTDGVRGPAGHFPIDASGAAMLGQAVGAWAGGPGTLVVVGRDTRDSGPGLVSALTRGLIAAGVGVLDGGVMPTAAVSCAIAHVGAAAGVMVTASHNGPADNGLKVMGAGGAKLVDPGPLEALLGNAPCPRGGRVDALPDPLGPWRAVMPALDLTGVCVLLDAANGAAAECGPDVLRSRGATVTLRGCSPDGTNINLGVGALHPPTDLKGADLGILLDGDGDRLQLLVPGQGALDGDDLLWLLDPGDGPVVSTVMSNGGLEAALGGRLVRTPVGDRFVAAAMLEHGAAIGGEPSGHLLVAGGPPTSCGLFTALAVLARHADASGRPQLPLPLEGWTRWPQLRANIASTMNLDSLSTVPQARAAGLRVVARYSGTEPVVRVMVEGADQALARDWLDRITAELGGI